MKAIEAAAGSLRWIHPDVVQPEYELQSAGETVARLRFETGSDAAAQATGESAAGAWTFRQLGFLNPHIIVREHQTKAHAARFDATWSGGGIAEFPEGRHYRWSSNLWRAEWAWIDTAGKDVIRFKRSFDVIERNEGTVEVDPGTHHVDVLTLLGWFLIILVAESGRPS
ncbi:MAG TPA: hypothetical protein VM534_04715 [Thermoanaerobaculia bacterium]|nr:hypothetical protein [Thermoanaerobaculia bacterium]